jgi:hypothetical protein
MLTSRHRNTLHMTRSLIVVWILALVMGSLAHAGHDHEKELSQHQTCEYCIGFAHISGGASAPTLLTMHSLLDELPISFESFAYPQRIYSIAQPRAPPAL